MLLRPAGGQLDGQYEVGAVPGGAQRAAPLRRLVARTRVAATLRQLVLTEWTGESGGVRGGHVEYIARETTYQTMCSTLGIGKSHVALL